MERGDRKQELTRRGLLTGGVVAAAGAIAAMVTPGSADAADGDPLTLGADNSATAGTHLHADVDDGNQVLFIENTHSTEADPALHVVTSAPNSCAIMGEGTSIALDGNARGVGVRGKSDGDSGQGRIGVEGVLGRSVSPSEPCAAVLGRVKVNGDEATAASDRGVGVMGFSGVEPSAGPDGTGVRGVGSEIGVRAESAQGSALDVRGKASFSRSGVARIHRGRRVVKVTGHGLGGDSTILATPQSYPGYNCYITHTQRISSWSFLVCLNRKAPRNIDVAWFIVN